MSLILKDVFLHIFVIYFFIRFNIFNCINLCLRRFISMSMFNRYLMFQSLKVKSSVRESLSEELSCPLHRIPLHLGCILIIFINKCEKSRPTYPLILVHEIVWILITLIWNLMVSVPIERHGACNRIEANLALHFIFAIVKLHHLLFSLFLIFFFLFFLTFFLALLFAVLLTFLLLFLFILIFFFLLTVNILIILFRIIIN